MLPVLQFAVGKLETHQGGLGNYKYKFIILCICSVQLPSAHPHLDHLQRVGANEQCISSRLDNTWKSLPHHL